MFAAYFIGGWEVVLILAVILFLLVAKNFAAFERGLREGVWQFRKQVRRLVEETDQEAHDAGESLGGIYGKPAAQALTPDNRTAELYDPAAFESGRSAKRMSFPGWRRVCGLIWRFVCKLLGQRR